MRSGFDRAARGQRRAAKLLANLEESRQRTPAGRRYDRQHYDGSQAGEVE